MYELNRNIDFDIQLEKPESEKYFMDKGYKKFIVFSSPSFDNCIVGITKTNRAVYSLSAMIKKYSTENKVSEDEALEFIDYKTIGVAESKPNGPIVWDDTVFEEDFYYGYGIEYEEE